MPKAIPDSSVVINLAGIERLTLLREFHDPVVVPPAVVQEVVEEGQGLPGSSELKAALKGGWISVQAPVNEALVTALKRNLGDGESEVIALGTESDDAVLLLDDKEARVAARDLGLRQTGIVGVLLRAKLTGRIESLSDELGRLRNDMGFWLDDELVARILVEAGEKEST